MGEYMLLSAVILGGCIVYAAHVFRQTMVPIQDDIKVVKDAVVTIQQLSKTLGSIATPIGASAITAVASTASSTVDRATRLYQTLINRNRDRKNDGDP